MAKLTKITCCEETRGETEMVERWLNLADVDEVKQREPKKVELWVHTEQFNYSRIYLVEGKAPQWAKLVNDAS